MIRTEKKYHKKEIASEQLKTAVNLFLMDRDFSSVITLSSAAGNILSQLARNAKKETFIDYACKVHNHNKKTIPGREKYKHAIDKMLGVISHKHMRSSDAEIVELDLSQCALDCLVIAISDYITLYGQEELFVKAFLHKVWSKEKPFVRAFLNRIWHTADSNKSIREFKDAPNDRNLEQNKNSKKKHKIFIFAENQLKTAIVIFCSGGDKFSAITLAGAADSIFWQLVTRAGKDNFTKIMLKKENDSRKIEKVGREMNDVLCINALKHLDPNENEHTSLDADECALGAILKAIVNYGMLEGKNEKLINGFFAWIQMNLDLKKYNLS